MAQKWPQNGPKMARNQFFLLNRPPEDGGENVVEVLESGLGQHHRHREDAVRRVELEAVAGVARGETQSPDLKRIQRSISLHLSSDLNECFSILAHLKHF